MIMLLSRNCMSFNILIFYIVGGITRVNAYETGTGPIILDELRCRGFERRLFDCPSNGLLVHNCGHRQDVGIVCKPGMF